MENNNLAPFPSLVLRAEKKDEIYTKNIARAIYQYWNKGLNPYICKDSQEKFRELRTYASGNQSIEKIKEIYSTGKDEHGQWRGLKPLNFKPMPTCPVTMYQALEILNKRGTALNVSFLDQVSTQERSEKKASIWIGNKYREFFDTIDTSLGFEPKEPEVVVGSKAELDAYEQENGIKLDYEVVFEEALNYIYNFDIKWADYISSKLKEDLFTIGVGGVIGFIEPITGKIDIRVVDPEQIIVENSKYYDYRDSKFFGEIIQMSMLDIIKAVKETEGIILTEEQLNYIIPADQYNAVNNRIDRSLNAYYNMDWYTSPKYSGAILSEFSREVLDFVYLSEDIEDAPIKKKVKVEITGKVRDSELKEGKIKQEGDKYFKEVDSEESEEIYYRVWRRGKWLVGTDIVWDLGLCYDQMRDEYDEPVKPFHIIRTATNSIVEIIRPNLDELDKLHMELQNEFMNGHGNSISIDVDALMDIKMGGKNYSPQELIKIWKLENIQFYRSKPSGTALGRQHNEPIQERAGGIGQYLQEIMGGIAFHINKIQQNSGLNAVAMAQNPNPEVTLGQSEIALGGANNAIAHLFNTYKVIKESSAYQALLLLQKIAKEEEEYPEKEESPYKAMLGERQWKAVQDASKKDIRKVALKIQEMPTSDEMQFIMQIIQIGLTGGKNGNAAITEDEAIELYEKMREGTSLSMIRLLIKNKREAREKESQRQQQEMIAAQGQAVQEQIAQKQQGEMQQQIAGSALDHASQMSLQEQKAAQEQAAAEQNKK